MRSERLLAFGAAVEEDVAVEETLEGFMKLSKQRIIVCANGLVH